MSWNSILKSAIGIAALGMACGAQAGSNGVKVTVTPEKNALGASDDVVVNVTLTNTSSTPQYVLKARTPFEGLSAPLFDVTRDGAAVPYTGALVKRAKPTAADYYLLKPGASHTVKVELSALYDMSVSGDYSIRYRTASPDLFLTNNGRLGGTVQAAGSNAGIGELQSEAATLYVQGRLPRGSESPIMEALKRDGGTVSPAGVSYASCSSSQQSTIASAITAAKNYANGSVSYMTRTTMGPRYTKWFGTATSSRVSTVRSHYNNIKSAFDTKNVVVDCSCRDSSYAYVYPTQPYRIYVCNAFWSAPMTGTDSKGGTLVHEMSHFNVVAGTDDHAYGQSAAASLAISNPTQAVDNADSHEYFSENNPALN
ncbi:peptidase M35 [Massilia sp. Dwa41.01b]|uniref:M35 family metallo-endopeptidase n=1 Tax=unclassified Massilia TaxID=2609279 RepID=UPI001600C4F6|nr:MULTISPECIES: M35 family metallo-endopeptidase [unclassified Massilia]QNA90100.1 peptidase M35 [Massilia sp. Dwa41.01b]QNB00990.1 peptidase M35 [Massilia sp. Se16.2.3]